MDTESKGIKQEIEQNIANGLSKPQAISIVAKKYGVNPYRLMSIIDSNAETEKHGYNDVKTKEGSFVTLKNDASQKQYEVININNKDAIVLRNTDNNEEITASETEITPVITENGMNNVNEAQYSVSINGLETQDAAALSQMFDLANQAEGTGATPMNGMEAIPEPMNMEDGTPMDMDTTVPAMGGEGAFDDEVPFDEELPAEAPVAGVEMTSAEEPAEPELAGMSADEMGIDDMMDAGMYDENEDTDVDYEAQIEEALRAAGVELNEAEEIIPSDTEGSNQQDKFAEEITEESADEELSPDVEAQIEEALRAAGVEVSEAVYQPAKKSSWEELCDEFKQYYRAEPDDICVSRDNKNALVCRNDGHLILFIDNKRFDLGASQSVSFGEISKLLHSYEEQGEEVFAHREPNSEYNPLPAYKKVMDYVRSRDPKEVSEAVEVQPDMFGGEDTVYKDGIQEYDFNDIYEYMNKYFPKLDFVDSKEQDGRVYLVFEGKVAVSGDTFELIKKMIAKRFGDNVKVQAARSQYAPEQTKIYISYIEKGNDGEDIEEGAEYHEVSTDEFGAEASEGSKQTISCKETVNEAKIKSIYETAKKMYAKKDVDAWDSLDRRYVEKLIKEGCSYKTSCRIIMEAKKGK
jgi:hypothetical protein